MASGYPRGRDDHNRAHTAVQSCTGCRTPMRWVTMPGGKRNPLELEPGDTPEHNVLVIEGPHRWALGIVIQDAELLAETRELGHQTYRSHFADQECPRNAERRARERKDLA